MQAAFGFIFLVPWHAFGLSYDRLAGAAKGPGAATLASNGKIYITRSDTVQVVTSTEEGLSVSTKDNPAVGGWGQDGIALGEAGGSALAENGWSTAIHLACSRIVTRSFFFASPVELECNHPAPRGP